jgi:hypothetical protein
MFYIFLSKDFINYIPQPSCLGRTFFSTTSPARCLVHHSTSHEENQLQLFCFVSPISCIANIGQHIFLDSLPSISCTFLLRNANYPRTPLSDMFNPSSVGGEYPPGCMLHLYHCRISLSRLQFPVLYLNLSVSPSTSTSRASLCQYLFPFSYCFDIFIASLFNFLITSY